MDRVRRLLVDLDGELAPGITATLEDTTVTVTLPGGRFQKIRVDAGPEFYSFTSTVLGPTRVRRLSPQDLAHLVFNANDNIDLIAFTLDPRGRFVGRIEQPAATLDREELRTYLLLLARECDRLEFLLTGRDVA